VPHESQLSVDSQRQFRFSGCEMGHVPGVFPAHGALVIPLGSNLSGRVAGVYRRRHWTDVPHRITCRAMSDANQDHEVAYHLLLDAPEAEIAGRALRLLISDEAHEPGIRALAREAIELVQAEPEGAAPLTVPLTAPQMKIVHTAVKLLLLDTQREQESERQLLHAILDKLPDEHALRAIELE